jgi:hypothetical protein
MKLYGKDDDGFMDLGDFTGKAIIRLDFNTIVPLLEVGTLLRCFSVCEDSFEKVFRYFKKNSLKRAKALLIFMRVPEKVTAEQCRRFGMRCYNHIGKHIIAMWAAQEYDRYRIDFYFYKMPKEPKRMIVYEKGKNKLGGK